MIAFSNKDYFKLYIWRLASILSGFLSMFVVVPHISRNQELFGIYSFIMSLALYLTYADLGFLSAGQKYAAEAFAVGDKNGEYRILGFMIFLIIIMSIPFTVLMLYLSYNPNIIIAKLTYEGTEIASNLFLILALLLPFQVIMQRIVQFILTIRLNDHLYLRIDLIANVVKILSVYYFFRTEYRVVEFVTFGILITILSQIIILASFAIGHQYNIFSVFKAIKFSRETFDGVKKLAVSSLLMTFAWILYYELDLVLIGRWLGASQVAIYAVSFTFLNFMRTLWNALYSPFAHRFNHLVAAKMNVQTGYLLQRLMENTFLPTLVVTMVLIIASEAIVFAWVGHNYTQSVSILRLLLIGSLTVAIIKPAGYYFTAHTTYSFIHVNAIITPIIFIVFLIVFVPYYELLGFALAKAVAIFASTLVTISYIRGIFNPINLLKIWYKEIILLLILMYPLVKLFATIEVNILNKGVTELLLVLLIVCLCILTLTLILFVLSKRFRELIYEVIGRKGVINSR